MPKYIECESARDMLYEADAITMNGVSILNQMPAANVVSVGVLEQVRWERDVALEQLAKIGKGLCEKMDDVRKVVLCRDCIHNKGQKEWADGDITIDCGNGMGYPPLDWFCADGDRRGADMREGNK